MFERVRIYGEVLNKWTTVNEQGRKVLVQKEIAYKEYYFEPEIDEWILVSTGSEDFTPESYERFVCERFVYTWDGEKINKGGHRWFEDHGIVKFRTSHRKNLMKYLKTKYDAELIQLRK